MSLKTTKERSAAICDGYKISMKQNTTNELSQMWRCTKKMYCNKFKE